VTGWVVKSMATFAVGVLGGYYVSKIWAEPI
jgi:hypothetical protein